ncbi:MAG: DNA polymerase III subunit delta' [Lactobacillus sp.]|nr:DNA polymerase III subunit delta' [Lactobacillus sp.]
MEQSITELQPRLTEHFAKLVDTNKLAHAYLFSGPRGTGKNKLAHWVAQAVFCQNKTAGYPCLKCNDCRRISQNNQPDVVEIKPDGASIKVEQIRYLKSEFVKSGIEGNRKLFIIQNAEKMTTSAANSLLKFLEEPSGDVTAFLLTDSLNQILPTIVSRCQLVELSSLTTKKMINKLVGLGVTPEKANLLAHLTNSQKEASELEQDEEFTQLLAHLWEWFNQVLRNDWRAFVGVQTKLMPYATDNERQERLIQLILLLTRDILLLKYGKNEDVAFIMYSEELGQRNLNISESGAIRAVEAVLSTKRQRAVNVSFQNVLEALTLNLCSWYQE